MACLRGVIYHLPWLTIHNIKSTHVGYYHAKGFWDWCMYKENKWGLGCDSWVESPCMWTFPSGNSMRSPQSAIPGVNNVCLLPRPSQPRRNAWEEESGTGLHKGHMLCCIKSPLRIDRHSEADSAANTCISVQTPQTGARHPCARRGSWCIFNNSRSMER